jgi:hypothetical protein
VTTQNRCNKQSGQRNIAMASISIHNETAYTLTDGMMQDIIRDAQEHFGEEVRAIRVQSGIARHALNTRTREVRYAFSPQDFGLASPPPMIHESFDPAAAIPTIDEESEAVIFPGPFEDVEEDEEEDDVFTLDDLIEDAERGDDDNVIGKEDEEDEWR